MPGEASSRATTEAPDTAAIIPETVHQHDSVRYLSHLWDKSFEIARYKLEMQMERDKNMPQDWAEPPLYPPNFRWTAPRLRPLSNLERQNDLQEDLTSMGFKEPSFFDRQAAARNARKDILEKFKAKPGLNDPEVLKRAAEREELAAKREEARKAREAAKAEQQAREQEQAAAAAAEAARLEAEKEATEAELKAQQKAARDARYAARKARKK